MISLQTTIKEIASQDSLARAKARERLSQLTMPYWALGRLMDMAEELAGMTSSSHPPIMRKAIVIMAADHGVTKEGVSKYPQGLSPQAADYMIAAHRSAVSILTNMATFEEAKVSQAIEG